MGPFWTGLGSSPNSCSPVLARVYQRTAISSVLIILVTDLHPEPPRVAPKTTSPSVVRAGILNPGGLWIEFKVWMGRKQTTFIASPLWLQGGDSYTLENGKPEGSIAAAAMTSAETGHVSLPHVSLGHSATSGTYIFTGGSS